MLGVVMRSVRVFREICQQRSLAKGEYKAHLLELEEDICEAVVAEVRDVPKEPADVVGEEGEGVVAHPYWLLVCEVRLHGRGISDSFSDL